MAFTAQKMNTHGALLKALSKSSMLMTLQVRGSTNVDSPFVDFVIYAEGESAPMSDEEAECIADAINDIGIKLGTICTMQSSKPGAWIEEV